MADNLISGLFSGLNTSSIVSKLIAVEKKPLYILQRKKASYEKQISSYGDLLSKLSSIRDSLDYFKRLSSIPLSASSSNAQVVSASVSSSASTGNYDVEVKQLARPHRLISTSGVSSESSIIVTGSDKFFKFQVGTSGEVQKIALYDSMTLMDLKNTINSKNAGVTASVVNTGSETNPYKLVISANNTGSSNNIVILQDDTVFGSDYSNIQVAQNAIFKINGIEMERASNTVSDVIDGVTLTFHKGDNYATTVSINVYQDMAVIKNKLNFFVAHYNAFINAAKGLSSMGQVFATESSLDRIINTLRTITTKRYNDIMPVHFGLTHDKNGFLQVNDSAFSNALEKNPQDVIKILKELSESLDTILDNIINATIPSRREGLRENIKSIEQSISLLEVRLTKKEEVLKKKFAQLEQTVGNLQSRGDYLIQQLSKISKTK